MLVTSSGTPRARSKYTKYILKYVLSQVSGSRKQAGPAESNKKIYTGNECDTRLQEAIPKVLAGCPLALAKGSW